MALDAVTKLKDEIAAAFSENLQQDAFIQDFLEKAKQKSGALTLEDVQKFSERLGEAMSKALLDTVGADVLTDEELKREVTSRLVRPMLEQNFDNIQAEANRVQKIIDESDGIGLNGVSADFPEDRAAGLVDKVNESESAEEAQGYFKEPIVNFHMHGYDSWVEANAKFRADAGMESKIIRRGHFGMCAWCAALAGTFEYGSDDMPEDVFRRHQYCKCVVLFTSERGKVRDVHSKIEYSAIRDARVARIRQLEQQRKASPEELEARKNLHKEIVRLNPESLPDVPKSTKETVDIELQKMHNETNDREQHKIYRATLGEEVPENFQEFQRLKYEQPEKWKLLKETKSQTEFVNNASCVTTPKKYTHYFLDPEKKHAADFLGVGYTRENPLQLRYDMARQFDMEKAVDRKVDKHGVETFNIYMNLGVTERKSFLTGWQIDQPGEKPRIITGFRKAPKQTDKG